MLRPDGEIPFKPSRSAAPGIEPGALGTRGVLSGRPVPFRGFVTSVMGSIAWSIVDSSGVTGSIDATSIGCESVEFIDGRDMYNPNHDK